MTEIPKPFLYCSLVATGIYIIYKAYLTVINITVYDGTAFSVGMLLGGITSPLITMFFLGIIPFIVILFELKRQRSSKQSPP